MISKTPIRTVKTGPMAAAFVSGSGGSAAAPYRWSGDTLGGSVSCRLVNQTAAQEPEPLRRRHQPIGLSTAGRGEPAYLALLLIMAGDIETNPGPEWCSCCGRWLPRESRRGTVERERLAGSDWDRVCGECARGLRRIGVRDAPEPVATVEHGSGPPTTQLPTLSAPGSGTGIFAVTPPTCGPRRGADAAEGWLINGGLCGWVNKVR